jgi:hypothetical protein
MKLAFGDCAFAKETSRDSLAARKLVRKSESNGER